LAVPASDTIVALSTPPGRSGIGVIRLSGPDALALVQRLAHHDQFSPEPNRVTLQTLNDPTSGEILDRALITYFRAPHSFTGEDAMELSCHGSPVLLLHVIDALLQLGARAAAPGEFTMRALANGQINLSQAEAIRDLIDAQTHTAVRQAARQLGGELSARLQPIKDALLNVIVPLESSLEFVEDDLPALVVERISGQLSTLIQSLDELATTFRSGRLLKEGLKITLVGRPNVGKSSVFNSLLRTDRAIVTDIPGTTRDSLSELINIQGVPVLLTDTAGVRSSNDLIESIGIERTRRAMADADLLVVIIDGTQPLTNEDFDILAEARENKYLIALNKNDLQSFAPDNFKNINTERLVHISAKTGIGLDIFRDALLQPFIGNGVQDTCFLITNARHYGLLRRTTEAIHSSKQLLEASASEDLILVGLYDSLRFLGEITGETTPDDVLTQIFATFCIGK
jgi:tRNA modification GTPase